MRKEREGEDEALANSRGSEEISKVNERYVISIIFLGGRREVRNWQLAARK